MQEYGKIEEKASAYVQHVDRYERDYSTMQSVVGGVCGSANTLLGEHGKYKQSLSEFRVKREICSALYERLTFTEQEKRLLLSNDDEDD